MMMIEPLETRIAPATLVNPTTVTYTDVDGDLVTLKITKGVFDASLTALTFVTSGLGEQLQKIDLTDPLFAGTNITVTATRGPSGGDGFANVGFIDAADPSDGGTNDIDLGAVTIDGDLGGLRAGNSDPKTTDLKSLTVQSLGALGLSTQGGSGELMVRTTGSIGAITVKGDVYSGISSSSGNLGAITIGGSLVGTTSNLGSIEAAGSIGAVKIGGSIQGGSGAYSGSIRAGGPIASVTVGGFLEGGGATSSGSIYSDTSLGPIKIGTDVRAGAGDESGSISATGAIKSVTIGGSLLGKTGHFLNSQIYAYTTLGAVVISGDVRGGDGMNDASIGGGVVTSVTIGGSVIGGTEEGTASIFAHDGNIGTVTIGGSLEAGSASDTARVIAHGSIGTVKIGGSWLRLANADSSIEARGGGIGSVTIGIDLRSAGGNPAIDATDGDLGALTVNGSILGGGDDSLVQANGAIKTLTVKGSIVGSATHDVLFAAAAASPTAAAFGKVTVGGKVEQASFHGAHADSTMGAFTIGGDWIASTIAAGTEVGADGRAGTADDVFLDGGSATKLSTLTSLTIKGMAYGTVGEINNTDRYGIFAEKIGAANIGGTSFQLTAQRDYLLAGSTLDFFIGEKTNPISSYLVINEVLADFVGAGSVDDSREYIELRGEPGTEIAQGTYLVLLESNAGGNLGDVRHFFDLSGMKLGGAGFLVLAQDGIPYALDPDTAVVKSSGSTFTGLPGFSSDVDAAEITNGSLTYLLVQSATAPTITDDIDSDNNGSPDGTVFSGWTVNDSIGILDETTDGDRSYAEITFRQLAGTGQASGTVVDIDGATYGSIHYVGRYLNSFGSTADEWLAGRNHSYTSNRLNLSILNEEGNSRAANHLGAANFYPTEGPYEGTTWTFQDVDGDLVTVSCSSDYLIELKFVPRGLGLQLQEVQLFGEDHDGANLSIMAKRGPNGGDGFVNVGKISARDPVLPADLGAVIVDGDLGRIQVGDADLNNGPAIKSLTVHSLGAFGTTTQASGGNLQSVVNGSLGALIVKSDIRDASVQAKTTFGSITIGGSLIGGAAANSGSLITELAGNTGAIKIGGSVLGGAGANSGAINLAGNGAALTIGGSVEGGSGQNSGRISAHSLKQIKIGGDLIGGPSDAGDFAGTIALTSAGTSSLGIGGSVRGGASDNDGSEDGQIWSASGLGAVTIGGSIIGGVGDFSGSIRSSYLTTLKVGGSIVGGEGLESGGLRTALGGNGITATIGGSIIGGGTSYSGSFVAPNVKSLTLGGSLVMSANGGGNIFVNQVLSSLVISDNIDARLAPDGSGAVHALEIKSLTVNGWVLGSLTGTSTVLAAADGFGTLTVKGSLLGASAANPLKITGLEVAITSKTVAFGTINVGGKVQNTTFNAGNGQNGDAQIGAINIGGDFIASRIAAGTVAGGDGLYGTSDDTFIGSGTALLSKIASLTVKGMAYGTAGGTDEFRVLAQTIGKITVGGTAIPVTPGVGDIRVGPTDDLFVRDAS